MYEMKSWLEFPIRVEFDYSPAEPTTWDDAGCNEDIEITDVFVGKLSVIGELSHDNIQTLEIQASDHMVDLREAAEESHAESMWEERMMMGCPA